MAHVPIPDVSMINKARVVTSLDEIQGRMMSLNKVGGACFCFSFGLFLLFSLMIDFLFLSVGNYQLHKDALFQQWLPLRFPVGEGVFNLGSRKEVLSRTCFDGLLDMLSTLSGLSFMPSRVPKPIPFSLVVVRWPSWWRFDQTKHSSFGTWLLLQLGDCGFKSQ